MTEVREGWETKTFGELFGRLQYGLTAKADHELPGLRFLRITDIKDTGLIDWKLVPSCIGAEDDVSRYKLADGDFVFARSGSIEKAARVQCPPPAVFASYLIRGVPVDRERADWLAWFIRSPLYLEQIRAAAAGIGLSNVNATKLSAVVVPIPPVSEQHRIVAKLDSLLKHSKSAHEELGRVPRLIERYRQAILELAFSGLLTAQWRERSTDRHTGGELLKDIRANRMARATTTKDRAQIERAFENGNLFPREDELGAGVDLPDSWTSCRIGAIGTVCNGSTPSRGQAKYWAGSIPWVSSGEVRNNVIAETRELITRAGYENSSVKLLPKGTVLLAMIGEGKTRGQSAILGIEATINQNIAAVVIDHGMVLPEFLWRWFQLQYQQTRRRGAGNGPKALNCQAVRDLPFVLPPLAEQREVVSKLNTSLSVIETTEVEASRAFSLLDRLEKATLGKAFRGELLPQSPGTI